MTALKERSAVAALVCRRLALFLTLACTAACGGSGRSDTPTGPSNTSVSPPPVVFTHTGAEQGSASINGVCSNGRPDNTPAEVCGGINSPGNPFPCCCNNGNCTWYAWHRAQQEWGVNLVDYGVRGRARVWADQARSRGLRVDSAPQEGAIAVSTTIYPAYGHVAWVLRVYEKRNATTGMSEQWVDVEQQSCCPDCPTGVHTSSRAARDFDGGFIHAPGTPGTSPNYEGRLDDVQCGGVIHGWARDRNSSEPIGVRLEVDGVALGTARADGLRPDLSGPWAWELSFPAQLRDGVSHMYRARFPNGQELAASPKSKTCSGAPTPPTPTPSPRPTSQPTPTPPPPGPKYCDQIACNPFPTLTSPTGTSPLSSPIRIECTLPCTACVERVEFINGNDVLGLDSSPPYVMNWNRCASPGSGSGHVGCRVIARYQGGNRTFDAGNHFTFASCP